MSFFACAVCPNGGPVPDAFRLAIEGSRRLRGRRVQWHATPGFLGVVGLDHGSSRGRVARWESAIGIGVVRLDNRVDIRRWTDRATPECDDMELVLRYLVRSGSRGPDRVARLLGDFAFVLWDASSGELLAARDAFGVRPLYHAHRTPGIATFASRAELLAAGDDYDMEYLAARVSERSHEDGLTVYRGVRAVPGASALRMHPSWRDRPRITTYWTATDAQHAPAHPRTEHELVDAFRTLLIDGVRARLDNGARCWSHLSGGLDSSSVVSIAQWLAQRAAVPRGLAGTVSFVDPLGVGADEREYSDAVVALHRVRNETLPHQVGWSDVLHAPPEFDQPNRSFPTGVRDARAAALIRNAGGEVLLTGLGGDHLVLTTMFFFADWLARGLVTRAGREMAHRAALGRVSFWSLAWQNAVLPLLPAPLRRVVLPRELGVTTPWLTRAAARHCEREVASGVDRAYGGRVGHKYEDALAQAVAALPQGMPDRFAEDVVDVRHPFLHRPLVELALRLPPELCVRPHQRKWVLREAMRGILPESVRTRVGKSGAIGIVRRSLLIERPFIEHLLRDPILAQLGVIDARALGDAIGVVAREQRLGDMLAARAHIALDVELWLQLRAGRWAAADSRDPAVPPVVARR